MLYERRTVKIYLAGPMTGLPNYNFQVFFEAHRRLADLGFEVVNPALHDEEAGWVTVTRDELGGILSVEKEDGFDWHEALDWDLRMIEGCGGLYLLPGWSRSRGACREYEHAKRRGLEILGATGETPAVSVAHQPLVGLVGYAQSGKDTLAGYLGYRRIAFADPLKELALACNPHLAPDTLSSLRDWVEEEGWEATKAQAPGAREFLQNLGCGVRDVLGADTWVQAAFAKYDPTQPTVITDVRFPNEIAAIRARGGVIVRIDRPGTKPPNNHVSEFAWQSEAPDHFICNDGGLEALEVWARHLDEDLRRVA